MRVLLDLSTFIEQLVSDTAYQQTEVRYVHTPRFGLVIEAGKTLGEISDRNNLEMYGNCC